MPSNNLNKSLHLVKKRKDTAKLFADLQRKISVLLDIEQQRTNFYEHVSRQLHKQLCFSECVQLKKLWKQKRRSFKKQERKVMKDIKEEIEYNFQFTLEY